MINDGGPARTCSRCNELSTTRQGNQWLCDKHYRFGQMRANARRHNKAVPSHEEIASLPGANLVCPDCSVQMNWKAKCGQSTVASLQHYRDGTMAIVCRSCNTRHAYMPGDSYRTMNKACKYCPACGEVKSSDMFTLDAGRSGPSKRKSHCRECCRIAKQKWVEKNRDYYNMKQREGRARRKHAMLNAREANNGQA